MLLVIIIATGIIFAIPFVKITTDVPYNIETQYIVKENVTKINKLISKKISLNKVHFQTIDFTLDQDEIVKMSWSSSNQLAFLSVMKQSTYDGFYRKLIFQVGIGVAGILLSGGVLSAPIISTITTNIPGVLQAVGSIDYYALRSSGGSESKNFPKGPYKIVVLSLGETGLLDLDLSNEYQVLEDVVKHKIETRVKKMTKYTTIWQYLKKIKNPFVQLKMRTIRTLIYNSGNALMKRKKEEELGTS